MPVPDPDTDGQCARLRHRVALSILIDEQVITSLANTLATLHEADEPGAPDLERALRTHRVSILKHRAILGAAGIDV